MPPPGCVDAYQHYLSLAPDGPHAEAVKEVLTNSIPLSQEARKSNRIKSLSVAKLLAEAIRSIHEETSISELFI